MTPGLVLGLVGLLVFLIVVIPNLLRSRLNPQGSRAVGMLRTINTAATTYASKYDRGFPPTLAALGPPKTRFLRATPEPNETAAGLIDKELASGIKFGYRITYVPGPVDSTGKIQTYTVRADPISPGVTGDNYYFTDQSGVIRQKSEGEAGENDSPIAG